MINAPLTLVVLVVGAVVLLSVFFHFVPFFLWLSAKVSGVQISLMQLFLMRIRNVPPGVIVPCLIEAHKAGLQNITRDNLEAHYMTGGHVQRVVHALVSASKANIDLSFEKATAIDLAGRDVFEAVQTSVNPKVIDTPPVAAVAKNGIQLIAKARVTVRANIHQLVGGAGEDTILARVGEGIVSSIGSAETHEQVLENPDSISKLVFSKGLDAGTAYEILNRHCRHRRGQEHRCYVANGSGQCRQEHCTGQGRGTPRYGGGYRTGNEGQGAAGTRRSDSGRGRSAQGFGTGAARRKHGLHGLLQARKPEGRYGYA